MGQEAVAASVAEDVTATSYKRVFNELCHMVALSRTGKATKVVEALVERAVVLSDPSPGTPADLAGAINERFGVRVPEKDVERMVSALVSEGRLRRRNGRYVLDQAARAGVLRVIDDARKLESRVKERWLTECVDGSGQLSAEHHDQLWESLRAYMEQVFQEHGALSAELLQVGSAEPSADDNLVQYATRAVADAELPAEARSDALQAIDSFFASEDADRNEYIAQHLDATFTIFALSTPEAAATYLRDQMPPLKVFLDTNFIFELLDLHVDQRDISKELVAYIHDNKLPVQLVYHPRTLREIRDTLGAIGGNLRSRRWSPALSRATLKTGTASGVEQRYHALNAIEPVSPDVFMNRYEDHIPELLSEFGIEQIQPKSQNFTDEEKALLIMEYKAFIEKRRPNKDKNYKTLEHDAQALLSLEEYRNTNTSAVLSGALFLTNDRALQRFDWEQYRGAGAPSVVLPQALLQVLRPFGQASRDVNRRFVRAFRLPELRTAHRDYGETNAELRSHLATYEDLAEETAVGILGNELLRTRLESVDNPDEFRELVESEVVRLNSDLIDERDSLHADGKASEQRIRALENAVAAKDRQLAEAQAHSAELEANLSSTEEEVNAASASSLRLEDDIQELRDELARQRVETREERDRRTQQRRSALLASAALAAITAIWIIGPQLSWIETHDRSLALGAVATAAVIGGAISLNSRSLKIGGWTFLATALVTFLSLL